MLAEQAATLRIDPSIISHLQAWGIKHLTQIQVLSLEAGITDGASVIVSAPTSSGKTLVGELAVLAALQQKKRCVYLVSHKALADQKFSDFESRFGSVSAKPLATVGLSTGDREEGEIVPQLLVATYEKALAMFLGGQLDVTSCLVIADELQIIGESGRGPNIEALCSIFRQQKIGQFIALTATVGNPQELAGWLNCKLVSSATRDVELHQEIWSAGKAYSVKFGDEDGLEIQSNDNLPANPVEVVRHLVALGRGPVLLFTESRQEAIDYANLYGAKKARTAAGLALAEQLDLFSEPTEASEQLQVNAQKGVAFHTADLTPQERQVIEKGFVESHFEACFATSTLAAGVNFPFQSVVFPKLTYEWGGRQGTHMTRSDFRNMSGRAGRLGMHERGYAILLPQNPRELKHANNLVLPQNDKIDSQLVSISMRRCVLMLVSSKIVNNRDSAREFFKNTFFWHQITENNPKKLQEIIDKANQSIDWLVEAKFIEETEGTLLPTPLGKGVAQSGLLPTTARDFLNMMATHAKNIDSDFERHIPGLLHWICNSDEFRGKKPSRFLVYPVGRNAVMSGTYLSSCALLQPLDRTENQPNQCAHALILYCQGMPERNIRFQTNIPSGGVHRLAMDVAWVLDGLQRISAVPELGYPQTLTNKVSMLSRRVRWGAPAEALDIIRLAQNSGVPGFGRQRAMALLSQGLTTFEEIIATKKEKLFEILKSENRVASLLSAITTSIGFRADRYEKVHARLAEELGLSQAVKDCNATMGTDYEVAIKKLLDAETRWSVKVLDDGKQQNVPDLLVTLGKRSVLIECKTTSKNPPLIKKEEAFAVLQKAVDFEKEIHRVTLGKPAFDEHSKMKAQAAKDISLVEHSIFMEGVLRVLAGVITPERFLDWLSLPGVSEISRLGGNETYQINK